MQNTTDRIVERVQAELQGARAQARETSAGHFEVEVVWAGFAGKSELDKQRTVLRAIKSLMAGAQAPVHAIDKLSTSVS